MDIDEGSDQYLDLKPHWIYQYGRLKEAFAHMRYVPQSHVLAILICYQIVSLLYTTFITIW